MSTAAVLRSKTCQRDDLTEMEINSESVLQRDRGIS